MNKLISDLFRLDGKTAIVTGGYRGIGFAISSALLSAGARVAVCGRTKSGLEQGVHELSKTSADVVGIACDITKEDGRRKLLKTTESKFGTPSILVNNAGQTVRTPAFLLKEKEWDSVLDVNLKTVFFLSKTCAEKMAKKRGGRIVNIASLMSEMARPTITAYTASKGGLKMLTRALAVEWAPYGINVNAIGPGYFKTELTKPLLKDKTLSRWILSRIPLKKWGDVNDLKGAVIFLCSDASSYVTGQIIYVDGGWLAG